MAHTNGEELYPALDYLLARQVPIEWLLASQYLKHSTLVRSDESSMFMNGRWCPLPRRGDFASITNA